MRAEQTIAMNHKCWTGDVVSVPFQRQTCGSESGVSAHGIINMGNVGTFGAQVGSLGKQFRVVETGVGEAAEPVSGGAEGAGVEK